MVFGAQGGGGGGGEGCDNATIYLSFLGRGLSWLRVPFSPFPFGTSYSVSLCLRKSVKKRLHKPKLN